MKIPKNSAVVISPNGNTAKLEGKITLEAAQRAVDGYVEVVTFQLDGKRAQALVNEDGLIKQMVPNLEASLLVGRPLVGPVLVLTGTRRWT